MSHKASTYRGFKITSNILDPEEENTEVPYAVGRRGQIRVVEPHLVGAKWDRKIRYEIDRLLDPAILRDVVNLN